MLYESVFVDAPVVLQPADIAGFSSQDLGAAEASTADPALTPRGWWIKPTYSSDGKILSLDGLQESLLVLRDILKADRYEVCTDDLACSYVVNGMLTARIRAFLDSGTLIITHPPIEVTHHNTAKEPLWLHFWRLW